MKKLTELEELRRRPQEFWLGPVSEIHEIGEYTIVEFQEIDFGTGPNRGLLTDRILFSCYLNGKSTGFTCESLDSALVYLMAYKTLGPNDGPRAGRFFMKMIAPEKEDSL